MLFFVIDLCIFAKIYKSVTKNTFVDLFNSSQNINYWLFQTPTILKKIVFPLRIQNTKGQLYIATKQRGK